MKNYGRILVLLIGFGMMTLSGVIFHDSPAYGADQIVLDPASGSNPLYEEVILPQPQAKLQKRAAYLAETGDPSEITLVGQSDTLSTTEEAGQFLKPFLLDRETGYININVLSSYTPTNENLVKLVTEIIYSTFTYNEVPTEGDYLRWHYSGWSSTKTTVKKASTDSQVYRYEIILRISYHSSREEEAKMDQLVPELLDQLDLSGLDELETFTIIYNYITQHVSYDYDHVSDTSYSPQYTAYAALHDHKAVCQGYSLLLYRLLLEEGIGCRLISGNDKLVSDGKGGTKLVPEHGWNIVELDGRWYNVDATWDSNYAQWKYFLKSKEGFVNHTRSQAYEEEAFCQDFPTAQKDYYLDEYGTYSAIRVSPASMDEAGYLFVPCKVCDTTSCVLELPALRERSFQLTWDGNGGSVSTKDLQVFYGDQTVWPQPDASRTGYTCQGFRLFRESDGKYYAKDGSGREDWYSKEEIADNAYSYCQPSPGTDISTFTRVDGDVIRCKAQWKVNQYTVKYKANGGSGSMSSQTFTYGVSKATKANTFKKTGYSFKGWTVYRASDSKYYAQKKDGSKGWYTASAISKNGYSKVLYSNKASLSKPTKVNGDTLTLTAQWKGNTYTLKYKANGGTGSMKKQTCTYGTSTPLRANAFKRKGYSFKGWTVYRASTEKWYAKKKDGSKGWYSASTIKKKGYTKVVLSNKTKVSKLTSAQGAVVSLYAQWKKK